MDSKKEVKKFTKENGGLEVLENKEEPSVGRDSQTNKSGNNIVIGTLNVMAVPIKNRHEKHYKESTFHLIADIVLVLAVIVLGVSLHVIRSMDLESGVSTAIELKNDSASVGRVETFDFTYANNSEAKMENVFLSVQLPENFKILSCSPENVFDAEKNTFSLRDLEGGASGKVSVSGVVVANVGSQVFLSSTLNYLQDGKERNVLKSLDFSVEEAALDFEVDLPDVIFLNSPFEGRITIHNDFEIDVSEIELSFVGEGLYLDSSPCEHGEGGRNTLCFNESNSQDGIIGHIGGVIKNESVDKIHFNTFAYIDGEKIQLQSYERGVVLKKPMLTTRITNNQQAVKIGDQVEYTVYYENGEAVDIDFVEYRILPSNKNFKINNIEIKKNSVATDFENNILSIGKLSIGEAGRVVVLITFERLRPATEQKIGILIRSRYRVANNDVVSDVYSSVNKLFSNTSISSSGYYYGRYGDQLGIGPVPPIVGIPTSFWIFWEVENRGNELDEFAMTATLEDGITFTKNKSLSGGRLVYSADGKKVVWKISQIDSAASRNGARFEISYVPGVGDAGEIKKMVDNIQYNYRDVFLDKIITGSEEKINTRLKDDNNVTTDGIVRSMDVK